MKQYLDLMRDIIEEGEDVQSGATIVSENRKPTCRFLLGPQLRFDLREGFPAVTTKKLLFDWVVDEVLWFLRGETNVNTLGRNVPIVATGTGRGAVATRDTGVKMFVRRPIWDEWADANGDVPYSYGSRWRRWEYPSWDEADGANPLGGQAAVKEWDQVARIVADLKAVQADPTNRARRRIILTAWDPPVVPKMGLPPCHTESQFLPTNGYLDCVTKWRSIDTFTGMPFNIAQYALLTTIFAGVTGLIPRRLVCNIVDCHLYDNQFEVAAEQCVREPRPSPYLRVDDRFFAAAPDLTPAQLGTIDPFWFSLEGYKYHDGKLKAEIAV